MRKLVAATLVGAVMMILASPAGAANGGRSPTAKLCRTEYASLRGSGGEQFKNPGQCVAFVARGGQFAFVQVLVTYEPAFDGGTAIVTIDINGVVGDTVHLLEIIDGFVLSANVFSSEFPIIQTMSCAASGSVTITDNASGASDTEVLDPPPEACTGQV